MDTMNNKEWADRLIAKLDITYQYRWEVYDQFICYLLSGTSVWLDIGCGNNAVIPSLGHNARLAVGVDQMMPVKETAGMFVCGDIYHLPFGAASADLITLRFVVEHLEDIPRALSEVAALLKPNGRVLIITTNRWCPFVFGARFLPFTLKKHLLRILYRATSHDVQPTFHKFNSPRIVADGTQDLRTVYLGFVQDVNYARRGLFLLTFFWHLITKILRLPHLRSCMIAIYERRNRI